MLKTGRPYSLPQLNAPYSIVLNKLYDENIPFELTRINPSEDDGIKSSQNIVYSDEVHGCKIDDSNPIWIADDGEEKHICDGHHRYFSAMQSNTPLMAVILKASKIDANRILNKIQDIYEYENSQGLEEVEVQDAINYYGGDENQYADSTENEFLSALDEDNLAVQAEKPSVNPQKLIAYRKDPIKDSSVIGNFFTLTPIKGYTKYEIEFDNLLDTNSLGLSYKDSQQPAEILSKIWFPHVNFEELSKQYNTPSINLKNKANAEKAMRMGFDGIKFGESLVQGLK